MKKSQDEILDPEPAELNPAIGDNWRRQLAVAQAAIDRWEKGIDTVLVADEVGMGKTYVALAAMANHIHQTEKNDVKILLVAPSAMLAAKWQQDIGTFDELYVRKDARETKRLRSLLIADYWDMLSCLHDYESHDKARSNEIRALYFAKLVGAWRRKAAKVMRKRPKEWDICKDIDDDDPGFLDFCSVFSSNIANAFLDDWLSSDPVDSVSLLRDLDAANGQRKGNRQRAAAVKRVGDLFRRFAKTQDRYEPNIFIITMSALRMTPRNAGRNAGERTKRLNFYLASHICAGLHEKRQHAAFDRFRRSSSGHGFRIRSPRKWFGELSTISLWGLREAVQEVVRLRHNHYRKVLLEESGVAVDKMFEQLRDDVFRAKLGKSGIKLAVVDEAHNWKNGKNGAAEFKDRYASHVERKLLLSATPFQIDESELESVFDYAAAAADNPESSLGIVKKILSGNAADCLEASKRLLAAWNPLSREDARRLADLFAALDENADDTEVGRLLKRMVGDYSCSGEMRDFAEKTLDYREKLDVLAEDLRRVMIRHAKSHHNRHFHAGQEYAPSGRPDYSRFRPSLHPARGYGDERNGFLNYVGMRAMQLAREDGSEKGGARLLGGMTSSHSAFRAGVAEKSASLDLSCHSRRYFEFFMHLLNRTVHPKIAATSRRAIDNFQQGGKTLIFCERLATQDELSERIRKELAKKLGDDDARRMREAILRDYVRMELYLARSFLAACGKRGLETPVRDVLLTMVDDSCADDEFLEMLRGAPARQRAKLMDLRLLARLAAWARDRGGSGSLVETAEELGRLPNHGNALDSYLRRNQRRREADEEYLDAEDVEPPSQPMENEVSWSDIAKATLFEDSVWHGASPGGAGDVGDFHDSIWKIFESELKNAKDYGAKGDDAKEEARLLEMSARLLLDLPQGLRRVLMRLDWLDASFAEAQAGDRAGSAFLERIRRQPSDEKSDWRRTGEFLHLLAEASGSIRRDETRISRRQALWRGVRLRGGDGQTVAILNGSVAKERRVSLCAAFNSPLPPDILICTSIGAEGIDLHLYCADVIHHDLPWNPAKLEQRTGRLDRVGSLVERRRGHSEKLRINVGIPFLAYDYEQFQYDLLQMRAQKQAVLLGKPEFAYASIEEDVGEDGVSIDDERIRDSTEDVAVLTLETPVAQARAMPNRIIEYLRMDLRARQEDLAAPRSRDDAGDGLASVPKWNHDSEHSDDGGKIPEVVNRHLSETP